MGELANKLLAEVEADDVGAVELTSSTRQVVESRIAAVLVLLAAVGIAFFLNWWLRIFVVIAGVFPSLIAFTGSRPRLRLTPDGFSVIGAATVKGTPDWFDWSEINDIYYGFDLQKKRTIELEFALGRRYQLPSGRPFGEDLEYGITQDELLDVLRSFHKTYSQTKTEPPPDISEEEFRPAFEIPTFTLYSGSNHFDLGQLRKIYHRPCGTWSGLAYDVAKELIVYEPAGAMVNYPLLVSQKTPFYCGKCGRRYANEFDTRDGEGLDSVIRRLHRSITYPGILFVRYTSFSIPVVAVIVSAVLRTPFSLGIVFVSFIVAVLLRRSQPGWFARFRSRGYFWKEDADWRTDD